jgi:hypothetical protein
MWWHGHITEPIVAFRGIATYVGRPNLRPVNSTLPEHTVHAPHVVVGGAAQMLQNWQKNDFSERVFSHSVSYIPAAMFAPNDESLSLLNSEVHHRNA